MPRLDWIAGAPFAHRGLHDSAAGVPENSGAAFAAAAGAGYGIELDVRPSADGVPMVFHDATLERLAGREDRIEGLTAGELSQIRLVGSTERMPRLADALALVGGRVPLLIEIKGARRRGPLARAVWELIETYRGPCAVLAFDPLVLAWFARHAPAVARGQNTLGEARGARGAGAAMSSRLARLLARPHLVSHEIGALTHRAAARTRARGLPLVAWTVRGESERGKAMRYADNYMFEGFRP